MLIPIRCKNPPESIPFLTYGLILSNVLVFALTCGPDLTIRDHIADTYGVSMVNASPLTFFTNLFLHGDLFHLLGNMLFLWIFGCAVEGRLRTPKFATLYYASGIAGAALHLLLMKANISNLPLIGASGAIMGTVGAGMYMFPHAPVTFFYTFMFSWGSADWPLWGAAVFYLFFDVLGAVFNLMGVGGTAHLAHLGGATMGFLLPIVFRAGRDDEYVSETKALVHEVKDYSILTPTQLSEMAKSQPDNPEIAAAWVSKSISNGTLKPEAVAHFSRHLPTIIRTYDAGKMGMVLAQLSSTPGTVHSSYLLNAAIRLEREGQPQLARQLFESVRRDPQATPDQVESATFWLASIYEQWLNQRDAAKSLYAEFLQKWPISPMAPAVQERLARLP